MKSTRKAPPKSVRGTRRYKDEEQFETTIALSKIKTFYNKQPDKQFNKFIAKTDNQKLFIQSIEEKPITFGVGTAGTGKSFVALYSAIKALEENKISKIIMTRPVVEAGESLGFLPGEMEDKFFPFMRPLYDILEYFLTKGHVKSLLETGVVEIIPLAYLRGITFTNCIVVADELQNATYSQIKMLITRLGLYSKIIGTGDISQSDLPHTEQNGFERVLGKLRDIEQVGIINFTKDDIQRHPIIQKIVEVL